MDTFFFYCLYVSQKEIRPAFSINLLVGHSGITVLNIASVHVKAENIFILLYQNKKTNISIVCLRHRTHITAVYEEVCMIVKMANQ